MLSVWQSQIEITCKRILDQRFFQPKVAVILGSGLGDLANSVEHSQAIGYEHLPCFPQTHAAGHAGRLIMGYVAGVPVVMMQGRSHRYEGFSDDQLALPVLCMHALGASILVVTNAAGGLNSRYRTGDLMLIDQHIDFLWARTTDHANGHRRYRRPLCDQVDLPCRGNWPYDRELKDAAARIALNAGISIHTGTYLATLGPTYETRSEYRMFRGFGADAVGMSTVPEVSAANHAKMRVLAVSVITNVAATDVPQCTTHEEVIDCGLRAGPRLMRIISGVLGELAGQPD
jgi:purine-nucleoside phosphorylase